jgi:hypothetical protein
MAYDDDDDEDITPPVQKITRIKLKGQTSPAPVDDEKLVERLRQSASGWGDLTDDNDRLMLEAADRLQSLSDQARLYDAALQRLADYAGEIRALSAEMARLRGVLVALEEPTDAMIAAAVDDYISPAMAANIYQKMYDEARAAL